MSPNHLIRAGLVGLVAQLGARVVVTQAASPGDVLEPHDVAIHDLGAMKDSAPDTGQRSHCHGTAVIGLIYAPWQKAPRAAAAAATITLATTPEELFELLQQVRPARRTGSGAYDDLRLPAGLTEQEFRVLELIGAGLSNAEIAKEMYLSPNSVKTYIRGAYKKIGATDRPAAFLWAIEHGLTGTPRTARGTSARRLAV